MEGVSAVDYRTVMDTSDGVNLFEQGGIAAQITCCGSTMFEHALRQCRLIIGQPRFGDAFKTRAALAIERGAALLCPIEV